MPLPVLLRRSFHSVPPSFSILLKNRNATRIGSVRQIQYELRGFATQTHTKEETTHSPASFKANSKASKPSPFKFYFYSGVLVFTMSLAGLVYLASNDQDVNKKLKEHAPFFPWDILKTSSAASSPFSTKLNEFTLTLHSLANKIKEFNPLSSNKPEDSISKKDLPQLPSTPIKITLPSTSTSLPSSSSSSSSFRKSPEIEEKHTVPPSSSTTTTLPPLPSSSPPVDTSDPSFVTLSAPFQKVSKELEALLTSLGQSVPHVQPSMKRMCDLIHQIDDELQKLIVASHRIQHHHASILDDALAKQSETFHSQLEQKLANCLDTCASEKQTLTSQHVAKLHELESQFKVTLEQAQQRWEETTRHHLQVQHEALLHKWESEVQQQLDQERNGRLAKLDLLATHLHALEQSMQTLMLDNDRYAKLHALHAVVQALHTCLSTTDRDGLQQAWHQLTSFVALDPAFFAPLLHSITDVHLAAWVSLDALHQRFSAHVAPQLRPLACVRDPERFGFFSYSLAKVCSWCMWPLQATLDPSSVGSVVDQVELALRRRDLDGATRTLNTLRGWPKALAQDWLESARWHLELKLVLDTLEAQAELLTLEACRLP